MGRSRDGTVVVGGRSAATGGHLLCTLGLQPGAHYRAPRPISPVAVAQETLRADRSLAACPRSDEKVAQRARAAGTTRLTGESGYRQHRGVGGSQPAAASHGPARRTHSAAEPLVVR